VDSLPPHAKSRFGPFLLLCAALLPGWSAAEDRLSERELHVLDLLSRSFRQVYQRAAPTVVLVNTRQALLAQRELPPSHPRQLPGLGSGVLVSSDGYILSNHHVIENADAISVTLHDRRVFPARVIGSDPLIDIALLKIDAQNLPSATLGRSDQLQIGDWVLAIGHPLGMGSTLTHGIVSALGRQGNVIKEEYSIESFIQTNAVINQGNSGGPLLNLRGEVVGINTAISTPTGYFIGYGLALPIDLAREAMNDLLARGRVVRGYLGITMDEVTPELIAREGLGLAHPQGVYINSAAGPARRGGVEDGDVLLQVEGREVNHPNEVQTLIYAKDPGDTVAVEVLRRDARLWLTVVLGEREEDQRLAQGHRRLLDLGLAVRELTAEEAEQLGFTPQVADQLGFSPDDRPVVIAEVQSEGPAASRGLEARDVITEVDQHRVTSLEELSRLVAGLEPGKSALFWVWRSDQGIDVRSLKITP
jgi:serine protease Do